MLGKCSRPQPFVHARNNALLDGFEETETLEHAIAPGGIVALANSPSKFWPEVRG